MDIVTHLSPNCDERQEAVDMLVLHYTGMQSAEEALARMCDPEAQVSAHYMVDEEGVIYHLVLEEKRAWHAGKSYWRGKESLNQCSIGIEIVNPGHEWGYRPFTTLQMKSVIYLCQEILKRHHIPAYNVVAHSDIAPDRKEDPGELFEWKWLAEEGVGLYPKLPAGLENRVRLQQWDNGDAVRHMQGQLAKYGYKILVDGLYYENTAMVVKAFKRHFCPQYLDAPWDEVAERTLDMLLEAAA